MIILFCIAIFLLSGVLWIDQDALPQSCDVMNKFRELGKKIYYVTNNSTKIRKEFLIKANRLGFQATEVINDNNNY